MAPTKFSCSGHKTHGAGATPGASGAWQLTANYTYFIDRGLVNAIASQATGKSVIEFGSGMGCYIGALKDSDKLSWADGYDGSPTIATLTQGLVGHADLTDPKLKLGCADMVLCLEVAEHIPKDFEADFLRTIDVHAARSVIFSWSAHVGGLGHVNPRDAAYVQKRMKGLGFALNETATKALRKAAKISWLKSSVARFDRTSLPGEQARTALAAGATRKGVTCAPG